MPLKLNREDHAGINLTSLIDILFLLIIFFMVSSKFTENEQHLALKLPKVNHAPSQQPTSTVLSVWVLREGTVQLEGKTLNLAQFEMQLNQIRRSQPDIRVTLRGEGQLSLDRLADVITVINRTGVKKLDLAFLGGQSLTR